MKSKTVIFGSSGFLVAKKAGMRLKGKDEPT
jgi:hypothetical protein